MKSLKSSPDKPIALGKCRVGAAGNVIRDGICWHVLDHAKTADSSSMMMDFGTCMMSKGGQRTWKTTLEEVWILMSGSVRVSVGGEVAELSRASLFDHGPAAVHLAPGTSVVIQALERGTEWTVVRTKNDRLKKSRFYTPADVAIEDRGAGLVQGACRRYVKTIFDYSTRPDSNLVVGEVINFPGRWSSYPPHHHPQPEVYHYRFTRPQGYGHAELGETVFRVNNGETMKIPGGLDHAQVSAPGYGMYYLWIVRHLPRRPYRGFTYTAAHKWVLDPAQQGWAGAPANG